ncbi:MAG: NAD(P)/FAD-dependent oxidoreductase [Spirochaetae bacterium HGW-Spirochaetae-8]|nr:MAG: NAD(P)/FAD-dependent oxidoreductase [Spirochaetae bacterium HGW-Spirochaetae-8]
MRLVVIGGGPAGLFAALSASTVCKKASFPAVVTVLERNARPGQKLLASGSGQCNLTQNASPEELVKHYGDNGRFLLPVLNACPPSRVMDWFTAWNVPLIVREDGKVFPRSLRAQDVLRVLMERCIEAGVEFKNESRVVSLNRELKTFLINLEQGATLAADMVIIATGGSSYPTTGSTGDGYLLAKALGHTIVPPHAALTGVIAPQGTLGILSGISFALAGLTLLSGAGKGRYWNGPLLITHSGISGPLVINNSRYLASGDEVALCFLPHEDGRLRTPAEMESLLKQLIDNQGSLQLQTVLHQLALPKAFISWVLQDCGVDGGRKAAEIGKKQLAPLARAIVATKLTISLKGCLEKAMVTAGGVALSEINRKTMRSQLVEGLYLAGEVMDIDGDTGGYNLQAAWSTGWAAGQAAAAAMLGALPS